MEKKEKIRLVSSVLLAIVLAVTCFLVYNNSTKNKEKDKKPDIVHNDKVVIDDFTYSFLKQDANKKNYIYSPLSIKYALNMLKEGASGNTLKELEDVLGDGVLTKYTNIEKRLSLANSMFVRDIYKGNIKQEYIDALKEKYDAETYFDPFDSAAPINNWISEKTFGIIKEVLKDEDVKNPDLKVVLVNALAIDMEWMYEFENTNTYKQIFHKTNEEALEVAMMHTTIGSSLIKYYTDDDITSLALPLKQYGTTNLEFIAIMPNSDLYEYITADNFTENLNGVLEKLHNDEDVTVNIALPKFEFETELDLIPDLKAQGIKDVFSAQDADLTKIGDTGLYVSDIIHKAKIELSEKGIKAAAVTVIMVKDNAYMIPEETLDLTFDKPFIFIIRDADTNEVWFLGTVYEPILWEKVKDNY